MKKSPTRLLLVLLAGLPSFGLAGPVQRVVSLDLCTDWMLARYAAAAQVAGLSPLNRQYPVPWVDSSWPVHDGTLEQVLQLKPDLVITGEYNAFLTRARLKTLGVRVEILPLPKTLTDVTAYEKRLLGLLGLPVAGASIAPPAAVPTAPRKRLLLLGANGIGTGRGTFELSLIHI